MMKKYLLIAAVAMIVITMAGVALAATASVPVSASITGTCRFSAPPTLAFGALDQTLGTNATTGPVNLSFWCTQGTPYTLTDPDGFSTGSYSAIISDGTDTIPVTITYTNATGNGSGKSTTINSSLGGTILNSAYIDKPAGNYSGSVLFTIAP